MNVGGVRILHSRFQSGLKPGDGEMIPWEIGETVEIVEGPDEGRLFVITSESRSHQDVPGEFVREGHFVGETWLWCMRERRLWFHSQPYSPQQTGVTRQKKWERRLDQWRIANADKLAEAAAEQVEVTANGTWELAMRWSWHTDSQAVRAYNAPWPTVDDVEADRLAGSPQCTCRDTPPAQCPMLAWAHKPDAR